MLYKEMNIVYYLMEIKKKFLNDLNPVDMNDYDGKAFTRKQCQQLKEKSNHFGRSIRMNASSKRQNLS